jgi:hypothetical protein
MFRRWPFLRVPAAIAGLLFCLEAALQVYVRFTAGHWVIQQNPYRVEHIIPRDDKRGFSYKPNFRDPALGLTIDQFGFRTSPALPAPAVGAKVVAALGDSVPFGHGLTDEDTYPFALNTLLAHRGSSLRVVNAGVQSYNLAQSIEHFRRDVRAHYQPVIVTLQAANDVGLLLHYRGAWTPDKTWEPYRSSVWTSLLTRSATMAILGSRLQTFASGDVPQQKDRMLQNEEKLLDEFTDECGKAGIAVILLPIDLFYYQTSHTEKNPQLSRWPAWQAQSTGWEAVFDDFNRVMAGVAHRKGPASGVYFFDTRACLDGEDREPLYVDFVHYSPEGNRRVAQGLLEFMAAHGLL